jgi:hypothetical protein
LAKRRGLEGKQFALAAQLDQAHAALLDHAPIALRRAARRQPGVTRAERGMPGEGQFERRGKDAHPVVRRWIAGGQQERALGKTEPAGERLHCLARKALPAMDHTQRIAPERRRTEHIDEIELHRPPIGAADVRAKASLRHPEPFASPRAASLFA